MTVRVPALLGLIISIACAAENVQVIDYALAAQREEWLRHPALGDPSCDSFERVGGPVVSGKPGLEWPVNGSLSVDPKDGAWYLFAGLYPKDYVIAPPPNHSHCEVHRSRDQGKTWENLGPPWPDAEFKLTGIKEPISHSPDMAACFADGRWHLVYDMGSTANTWETLFNPPPTGTGVDSGLAHAFADSLAGPWTRSPVPLRLNSQVSRAVPLLGKYRRVYGCSLLRRKNDWLLLYAMDSMPAFSWALVGATAKQPEGPTARPCRCCTPRTRATCQRSSSFFPPSRMMEKLTPRPLAWREIAITK